MIYTLNLDRIAAIASVSLAFLLAGCASSGSKAGGATQAPAAAPAPAPAAVVIAELPAPKKTILVFDADTNQAYEILGEVETTLTNQRLYAHTASQDQVREHLKRVAYAKYGDRLDAIISYRAATTIGGGGYWGAIGAVYGARNTDVRATGVAVRYTAKAKK